jgi:hypothetical protein
MTHKKPFDIKITQRQTLKGDLYKLFQSGRALTLTQIAQSLYGETTPEHLQKSYGVVSSVRKDAEERGILLHRVNVDGRDVYKFLNKAEEIRTRIQPTTTRIKSGLRKMGLIKTLLSSRYRSAKDVKDIQDLLGVIKLGL